MSKIIVKNFFLNLLVVLTIFLIDRVSKIYILRIAELENNVDIYITSYLNLYLIWNKGMAFGLFSLDHNILYNLISFTILIIIFIIIFMIVKSDGFKKYSLIFVLGGALGNFFDRIYYSAVPDFIDLNYKEFHWFVFNIADIFITIGIICLILDEIILNKKNKYD